MYLSETARSMQRQAVQLLRQNEVSTRELGKRLTPARVLLLLDREQSRLNDRLRHVSANDPRKVLERGYTITTSPEGEILKSIAAVAAGRNVRIEFHDGLAEARISGIDEPEVSSSKETANE
jgi:exodeoxyribonuclease VII large subunit